MHEMSTHVSFEFLPDAVSSYAKPQKKKLFDGFTSISLVSAATSPKKRAIEFLYKIFFYLWFGTSKKKSNSRLPSTPAATTAIRHAKETGSGFFSRRRSRTGFEIWKGINLNYFSNIKNFPVCDGCPVSLSVNLEIHSVSDCSRNKFSARFFA